MSADATLTARARDFVLASSLATYPDAELPGIVADAATAAHAAASAMHAALEAQPGQAGLVNLQSRYVELFDRGGQRASLYETEYGRMRGMSKGRDLADIGGFYKAFGLTQEESHHEMLDHIAVELEFYGVLLLKQAALVLRGDEEGIAVVEDARRKFLAEHLGGLAGAVTARKEVAADPVYASVFAWCGQLVAAECQALGVKAAPLDFFPDDENAKDMSCGLLPAAR